MTFFLVTRINSEPVDLFLKGWGKPLAPQVTILPKTRDRLVSQFFYARSIFIREALASLANRLVGHSWS